MRLDLEIYLLIFMIVSSQFGCLFQHTYFLKEQMKSDNEGSVGVDSCLGLFPGKVEKIFDGQKNINVGWHRPNFANEGTKYMGWCRNR